METKKVTEFDKKIDEALDKIAPQKPGAESQVEPKGDSVEQKGDSAEPKGDSVEPKGDSVEPKGDSVEPKGEPKEKTEVSEFDFKSFNERFGTEFADEENIKSSLSRLTELSDYDSLKTKNTEYETKLAELQAKYDEVQTLLDPRKFFANEDEYRRQLILQKHGQDINPAMLNKIVSADFSQMSDLDILVMGKRVGNPALQGGDQDIKEMIYRQLGVEEDSSEWTMATKNIISEDANSVRKELTKLKDVDVPEKVDYEKQRAETVKQVAAKKEEIKGRWTEIASEMVKGFNEFSLKDDGKEYFTYSVDEDFKKDATNFVVGYLTDNAIEPTKENLREAQSYIEDLFWRRYGNDMVKAYGKEVEARLTEKFQSEQDNPKPPNEKEAPPDVDDKQKDLLDYVRGGLSKSRKPGAPLFG